MTLSEGKCGLPFRILPLTVQSDSYSGNIGKVFDLLPTIGYCLHSYFYIAQQLGITSIAQLGPFAQEMPIRNVAQNLKAMICMEGIAEQHQA